MTADAGGDEEVPERRMDKAVRKIIEGWSNFFWDAFAALAINGISGDYVEFGSLSGTTMWLAHRELQILDDVERHLWGFDSFQGLPVTSEVKDEHPSFRQGHGIRLAEVAPTSDPSAGIAAFHAALDSHGVPRDAYTTVAGFYEDTLPPLGADGPPADVALAYIDCNLYTSTVTVLEFLEPRLKHGMIVAFDDWFCWSSTQVSGEQLALQEFMTAHPQWEFQRFKDVNWAGLSFVVVHTEHDT